MLHLISSKFTSRLWRSQYQEHYLIKNIFFTGYQLKKSYLYNTNQGSRFFFLFLYFPLQYKRALPFRPMKIIYKIMFLLWLGFITHITTNATLFLKWYSICSRTLFHGLQMFWKNQTLNLYTPILFCGYRPIVLNK